MLLNISIVVLLVAANGFFVAAEFALVKLRMGEIEPLALAGKKTARITKKIVENLTAYLSACQLGITLASLGLGWVGEPVVAKMLEPIFALFGLSEEYVHFAAYPVAFAAITFLHITIGEQVPKVYAINRHRPTALACAYPLLFFYTVLKPFIWVLDEASNLMLRGIGVAAGDGHGKAHSEEELRVILAESAAGGQLTDGEQFLIENALSLEDKVARSCMVPRNQIVYLDLAASAEENRAKVLDLGFTRYPVCEGGFDDAIIGVAHTKDVLRRIARGEDAFDNLKEVVREPIYMPETATLDVLLREFRRMRTHLAILVDEHGVVSGIITLEDVLEELVGEIEDEFDEEPEAFIENEGGGRFIVKGHCPLERAVAVCGLDVIHGDVLGDTVAGWLAEAFGSIPSTGESVSCGEAMVTVLEASPTRVKLVEIVLDTAPLRVKTGEAGAEAAGA